MKKKIVFIFLATAGALALYLGLKPSLKNSAPETFSLQGSPPSAVVTPEPAANLGSPVSTTQKGVNLKVKQGDLKRPYDIARDRKLNTMELQQLKKLTEENSKRIYAQMRTEEIQSLKTSIANDEKILKNLEANGTGIEDYKYIEQNLQKRRKRLKSLTR